MMISKIVVTVSVPVAFWKQIPLFVPLKFL